MRENNRGRSYWVAWIGAFLARWRETTHPKSHPVCCKRSSKARAAANTRPRFRQPVALDARNGRGRMPGRGWRGPDTESLARRRLPGAPPDEVCVV